MDVPQHLTGVSFLLASASSRQLSQVTSEAQGPCPAQVRATFFVVMELRASSPALLDTAVGSCSHTDLEVCICWALMGQSQPLPASFWDCRMSGHIQVHPGP